MLRAPASTFTSSLRPFSSSIRWAPSSFQKLTSLNAAPGGPSECMLLPANHRGRAIFPSWGCRAGSAPSRGHLATGHLHGTPTRGHRRFQPRAKPSHATRILRLRLRSPWRRLSLARRASGHWTRAQWQPSPTH